mmetsp:Transcript_37439/g.93071  ORF Transcript_37439/g.93071 Transcript_37439/m.93071 type:complete len:365 (+) Transcript_37439:894-1988(+)
MQQVVHVDGLAAELAVKVDSPGRQAAAAVGAAVANDGEQHLRRLARVSQKLVCVPAYLRVARVRVQAAEHAHGHRHLHLVRAGVARQRGVITLHVELVLRVQVELAQKAGGGRDVPVVLVLGRLLGLGLDEERSGGAEDMAPVVGCHLVKSSGVAALHGDIRGGKVAVALAPSPEIEVFAAERVRHLHRLLHLRRRANEDVHVRASGGPRHVLRLHEQLRGAPERPDISPSLHPQSVRSDFVEVGVGFGQVFALGGNVAVVEAPPVDTQLAHELEEGAHSSLSHTHVRGGGRGVAAVCACAAGRYVVPRPSLRGRTEGVSAVVAYRVPKRDAELQPLLHCLAHHHLALVVVPEGERLGRVDVRA